MEKTIGLIPARSGSVRIPGKNIRELAGHPLMAYSIASARESNIFNKIIVSSDDEEYLKIAERYGANTHLEHIEGQRYDYKWISQVLAIYGDWTDYFSILRPTSPFRSAQTIQRCFSEWDRNKYDSIRAVELVKQHPGKCWIVRDRTMYPLFPIGPEDPPWHSSQTQDLPKVYIQNASLEFSSLESFNRTKTISGWNIQAFITENYEGFDINEERDWQEAEYLIDNNLAELPRI